MRTSKLLATAALALAAATGSAHAQDAAAFYKGKTIRILVGFSPGGSYDFYARLAAEMLKAHLPGIDAAVVENKPGAGGLSATNFLYAHVPKDGTVLGVLPDTIANTQLLEPANAKWDVTKFNYIGSFTPVNSVTMLRGNAPVKSLDDMKAKEVNVACSGKNAQSYQFTAMLKNLGGYRFKMICGYAGFAGLALALERGEADLASNAWPGWSVTHKKQIESGALVPLYQIGLKRAADLPKVPLAQDVVTDLDAKKVIAFLSSGTAIGRALIAPPGVPADRVEYLRGIFDKMVHDPVMVAIAKKRGLELDPSTGKEVQKIVDDIVKTPPELIKKAAAAIR